MQVGSILIAALGREGGILETDAFMRLDRGWVVLG